MNTAYILKCHKKRVRIFMKNANDWSFQGFIKTVDEDHRVIGVSLTLDSDVEVWISYISIAAISFI